MALLQIKDLKVHYPIRGGLLKRTVGHVKAVDGLSIDIEAGKTYGLVGESGCGKSTTGRAILGLTKSTSGDISFEGQDLKQLMHQNRHPLRRDIQMIFQDPYSSLNPKKRVLDIIAEPLRNFEKMTKKEEQLYVQDILEKVGMNPNVIYKYPHEFSGGQRQRIGIARSLTLKPKLIIADEPVSALDVSVQAQVLNFMKEIQETFQLTYLFISHDLGIVRHMCDEIGIMFRGRLVESGVGEDIYEHPEHIYTQRLIAAIPNIDPKKREQQHLLRQNTLKAFETRQGEFFDQEGLPYPLKQVSESHYVALPQGGGY